MNKEEQIKIVLRFLNNKLSAASVTEREKVKNICENADITLQEVVEWYIDYVLRSC